MTAMVVIAIAGLFAKEPSFTCDLSVIDTADVAWLITATIFVLMMTPGLSFFYGGMVGAKNVISTMLQSFIAMGIISVLWVVFGFSLCFGDDIGGVIGNPFTFLMFEHVGGDVYTTPTGNILGGASGRCHHPLVSLCPVSDEVCHHHPLAHHRLFCRACQVLGLPVLYDFLLCSYLLPLGTHDMASRWSLPEMGCGGFCRWYRGARLFGCSSLGGCHLPGSPLFCHFVLLGAAMLWLGWFGFNAGSSLHADGTAVKAFLNTNTASATAMMTWIFFDCLRGRKPSAMGAAVGCVVGLVAITPSAGYVTVGQSIFISFVITIICNIAVYWRSQSRVDDALDVFPTHGTGGIFGTVLTGIFIQEGLIAGTWDGVVIFLYHLLAVAIVITYTFLMSYFGYWLIDRMIPMRVSEASERVGLDFSQHDEHYGLAHIAEREIAEYEEHIRNKAKN